MFATVATVQVNGIVVPLITTLNISPTCGVSGVYVNICATAGTLGVGVDVTSVCVSNPIPVTTLELIVKAVPGVFAVIVTNVLLVLTAVTFTFCALRLIAATNQATTFATVAPPAT